ncbi:SIS domain-containing protein [Trichloromonas sp.]|uniref:SIS domain-containing protein n=1 Tax=Trichloromonas sp. TaxID=3069249 RepID=UPI003D81C04C
MNRQKISSAVKEQGILLEASFLDQGPALQAFATQVVETFNQGGRLLVVGNGSLGAIANLTANLFLHRLSLERPPLPALSLGHDATLATSLVRDGQNRLYFSRQLRALANDSDIVLVLSDGQRDDSLTEALTIARQVGSKTALLTPENADIKGETIDFGFTLKTASVPRTIEGALFFGHLLCELVEGELFGI